MKILLSILLLGFQLSFVPAFANELDHENEIINAKKHAADLPQTLVVRKSKVDGSVAVYHSKSRLPGHAEITARRIDDSKFIPMKRTSKMKHELDNDSSSSGWYFYWNNYNYAYPTYYYYNYGYNYNYYYSPYYSYYAYPYYYTYYGWGW